MNVHVSLLPAMANPLLGPYAADDLGNTRQIARDFTPADVLSEETKERDWPWVCRAMHKQGAPSGQRCMVNLIDTVLLERGSMAAWYFTNKSSEVARKSERNLSLDKARHAFLKFSLSYPRNSLQWAAVFHYPERATALTREQFVSNLAQALDGVTAMQPYALPRGKNRGFVNFRHEYSIYMGGKDAAVVSVTHKYTAALPVGGTDPTESDPDALDMVPSKDTRVNTALDKMTRELVRFVENHKKVKVTKVVCEYCVDDNHLPWLVCTSEFLTVAGAAAARRRQIAQRKRLGLPTGGSASAATGGIYPDTRRPVSPTKVIGGSGTDSDGEGPFVPGTGPRHTAGRMGVTKGKRERLKDRREREALQNIRGGAEFQPTLGSTATRKPPSSPLGPPTASRRVSITRTAEGNFTVQDDGADDAGPRIKPGSTPAEMLGSTQASRGCPGDFCEVVLGLGADGTDPLEGVSGDGGGGGGFMGAASGGAGGAGRRFSMSMVGQGNWRQLAGIGGSAAAGSGEEMSEDMAKVPRFDVAYTQIAQARAEADLVDLMIRRHRGGQAGDYVQGEYSSEAGEISHTFPASYYRTVKVCSRCFAMYTKIEKERNAALAKRGKHPTGGSRPGSGRSRSGSRGGRRTRTGRSTSPARPGAMPSLSSDAEVETKVKGEAERSEPPDAHQRAMQGLARADAAISALTMSDLAEMRTFVKPPPAVTLVSSALMLLLTGEVMDWAEARRVIAGGERFTRMMLAVDPDHIPARRLRALLPLVSNPAFHPENVMPVCRAAAHLSAWVLGIMQYSMTMRGYVPDESSGAVDPFSSGAAHAWEEGGTSGGVDAAAMAAVTPAGGKRRKKGSGRGRSDRPQLPPVVGARSSTPKTPYEMAMARTHGSVSSLGSTGAMGETGASYGTMRRSTSAGGTPGRQPMSFAEKLEKRRQQQKRREARERKKQADQGEDYMMDSISKQKRGGAGGMMDVSGSFQRSGRATTGLSGTGRSSKKKGKAANAADAAARAARRRAQEYQSKRLMGAKISAGGPGMGGMGEGGDDGDLAQIHLGPQPKVFQCADGHTSLLYLVLGTPDHFTETVNFVVLHDFFDTLESTQILLREFIQYNRGQVLLINYPGQAFTTYRAGESGDVLNNVFLGNRVLELLEGLTTNGDFDSVHQKWQLVGLGNGGNIAAFLASRYHDRFDGALAGVTLVNSFAHVDEQLTAVLHSAVNVFSCFPDSRPDLPVSYFARFLFSEAYLNKVTQEMALRIYTAVTNPISLEGRIRLLRGALRHVDLRADVSRMPVPLILVQSTDDVLVSPANADPFLDGRSVRHLWSHEEAGGASAHLNASTSGTTEAAEAAAAKWLTARSIGHLKETLRKPDGALVLWLKSGHEVRQEAKFNFLRLWKALADPEAASGTAGTSSGNPEALPPGMVGPAGVVSPTRLAKKPQFGVPEHPQKLKIGRGREQGRSKRHKAAKEKGSKRDGKPSSAEEDGGAVESKNEVATEPELTPRTRRAQIQETEAEFEAAMREHKQRKQHEGDDERKLTAEQERATRREAKEAEAPQATRTETSKPLKASPIRKTRDVSPVEVRSPLQKKPDTQAVARSDEQRTSPVSTPKRRAVVQQSEGTSATPSAAPSTSPARSGPVGADVIPPIGADSGAGVRLEEHADVVGSDVVSRDVALKRKAEEDEMEQRLRLLREEQEARRRRWAEEDAERLALLNAGAQQRAEEREVAADARADALEAEARNLLLKGTRAPDSDAAASIASDGTVTAPLMTPADKARAVLEEEGDPTIPAAEAIAKGAEEKPDYTDLGAMFSMMEEEDKVAAKQHSLRLEEFKRVQQEMADAEKELQRQRMMADSKERQAEIEAAAERVNPIARGFLGRLRFRRLRAEAEERIISDLAATRIQSMLRGRLGRQEAARRRAWMQREKTEGAAARTVQRVFRGSVGRKQAAAIRKERATALVQRVFRGHLGRQRARRRAAARNLLAREGRAATKIQAAWRMHQELENYRELQILQLAAMQVQRMWRGWLGRKRAMRKRQWDRAAPGPERLKLGLTMIEGAKENFERQRQEIDALHRAQERAEGRVTEIQAGLKESEAELHTLERELREVDQLDADLREMTHNKAAIEAQIEREREEREMLATREGGYQAGASRPGSRGGSSKRSRRDSSGRGRPTSSGQMSQAEREAREQEVYALEVAIHMKKAEREKKRRELEAEFAGVFAEVEKKKGELTMLQDQIGDMEATRQRKDREFTRLQRNLTELLAEQKSELDSLREKGVQLETATATSAAAAAATAEAAKENEKRTAAIFSSTEELLKFQFMSMSLSYFSSLNMLSNLRDINQDTTAAAISSSADTAAAAAAAAAAANIPSLKQMTLGAGEFLDAATKAKKLEEAEKAAAIEEAKKALAEPFPSDVTKWRVQDVGRWLETLSLGQYRRAFEEAAVDGEFLMELRAEDLRDVLGVEHALHVRKLLVARDKIKPLSAAERAAKRAVEAERAAAAARGESLAVFGGPAPEELVGKAPKAEDNVPDMDTVFSQIRHNRIKRLGDSLRAGFNIETEDENGNTALLVAAQNVNKRAIEMLLDRGANINHQNKAGQTALHYCMAYDKEGALGEFLIDRGANDMLENKLGLSPYDGLE